jgi:hypothetical protein
MAKTKISEFDVDPSNNTDINSINIAEGCAPSGINNAIRQLMSDLKEQQTGASGDDFTVGGDFEVTGTSEFTGATTFTGAVVFSSTVNGASLGNMASQNKNAIDITGGTIVGITDLAVADGGTGASSITANSVVLGNGTSALSGNLVAPSTTGNVLTSNGTTWTSAAPAGLGANQTWQNVTGSRSLNTTYTNSTGKPIFVSVYYITSGTGNNLLAYVDSVTVAGMVFSLSFGTLATGDTFSFIVPAGSTYRIDTTAAPSISSWSELR